VLASRLANGVDQILGTDSAARRRVTISHLHAYAHGLLADSGRKFEIVKRDQLSELLAQHGKQLDRGKFTDDFIESEWNAVIDYWGLENLEEYEKVNRAGRGTALPAHHRRQLWQAFSCVRAELKRKNLLSWGDLCDETRRLVEANGARPFRHVIVDESQDLGPRELRFAATLAPPGPQSFFLAGDTGQLIYRYPFSWLSVGIDIRGRSQRLKVNYRTSEQIQRFADNLVGQRLVDADDHSDDRSTMSLLNGPEPEIVGGRGTEAEREALRNWIKALLESRFAADDIAIFARTKSIIERQVTPVLESLGLEQSHLSTDTHNNQGSLNVGTLHAAKGLEFRAVAVVGCDEGILPLKPALEAEYEEEAKAIALAREKQLLYVGCTRAREKLLVTYSHTPSRFLPSEKQTNMGQRHLDLSLPGT
jgi:superfamily I DNA/RNA helicase